MGAVHDKTTPLDRPGEYTGGDLCRAPCKKRADQRVGHYESAFILQGKLCLQEAGFGRGTSQKSIFAV
jgi:hypothetical protein